MLIRFLFLHIRNLVFHRPVLSLMRTAKYVSAAAPKSRAECAASEIIPIDPVRIPTTNLPAVRRKLASTELNATDCFFSVLHM